MKKQWFLLLLYYLIKITNGLEYEVKNGVAVFSVHDDETLINGEKRNSEEVVEVRLKCGRNRIQVENNRIMESSLEDIVNCEVRGTVLQGMYQNMTPVDLEDVRDFEEITLVPAILYYPCRENGIDKCDSIYEWLQIGNNEIAFLMALDGCESGDVLKENGQRICKRKRDQAQTYQVLNKNGGQYDGQALKGVHANDYTIVKIGDVQVYERAARRKRDTLVDSGTDFCDYTYVPTTTPVPTTTVPTTTRPTTSVTTTIPTTTRPQSTTTMPPAPTCDYLIIPTTTVVTSTTTVPTTTVQISTTTMAPAPSCDYLTIPSTTTMVTSTTTVPTTTTEMSTTTMAPAPACDYLTIPSTTTVTSTTTVPTTTTEMSTTTMTPAAACDYLTIPSTTTVVTSTTSMVTSTTSMVTSTTSMATSTTTVPTTTTEMTTTLTTTVPKTTSTETPTTTVTPAPICNYLDPPTTTTEMPTTTELNTTSSSTTSASTTSASTTTTTTFDFSIQNCSDFQMTRYWSDDFSINISATTLYPIMTYQCKPANGTLNYANVTGTGTCFQVDANWQSTSNEFPISTVFEGVGVYQLVITAVDRNDPTKNATHTLTITILPDPTTSGTSTTSVATSTASNASTSSPASSTSAASTTDGSTTSQGSFDFTLQNCSDFQMTRYWSANFSVNISATTAYPIMIYQCKPANGTLNYANVTGTGTCFKVNANWQSTSNEFPISTVFEGIGVYELVMTATDRNDPTKNATHTLTITILPDPTTSTIGTTTTSDASSTSDTSTTVTGSSTSAANGTTTDGSTTSTPYTTIESASSSSISTSSIDPSATTSSASSGASTSTSLISSTTSPSYDFSLQNLTWNATVNYTQQNFAITPLSVSGSIISNTSYECRTDSSSAFVLADGGTCFKQGSGLSFTSAITFTPDMLFVSPGTYYLRINTTEYGTGKTASHILTLNIIGDVSTTTDIASTATITTTSGATSDSASGATSDVMTTTDTPGTTTMGYDFNLTGLSSWEVTIYITDANFEIDPVPNLNPVWKSMTYECRNDSTKSFVLAKNSDCFNFASPLMQMVTFTSSISMSPVAAGFIGIGTYEIRINLTNSLTSQTASHILTVHVIQATTTTSSSNSDSSKNASNNGSGSAATTPSSSDGQTTTSAYDFSLTGSTWEETVYYSANFTIDPVPSKDPYLRTMTYECRPSTSNVFVLASQASSCFKLSDMQNMGFVAAVSFAPMSTSFVGVGTYEIRINLTDIVTGESASHVLTLHIVDDTTTVASPASGITISGGGSAATSAPGSGASSGVTSGSGSGSVNGSASGVTGASGATNVAGTGVTSSGGTSGNGSASGAAGSGVSGATGTGVTSSGSGATSSSGSSGNGTGTGGSGNTNGTGSGTSSNGTSGGGTGASGATLSGSGSGSSATSAPGAGGSASGGSSSGGSSSDGSSSGNNSASGSGATGATGSSGNNSALVSGATSAPGSSGNGSDSSGATNLSLNSGATLSPGSVNGSSGSGTNADGSNANSTNTTSIGSSGNSSANSASGLTAKTLKPLATVTPISAAEAAAIAAQKQSIAEQLAAILNSSSDSAGLSTNNSLLNEISKLSASDLAEVAASVLGNNLAIGGNGSTADILQTLTSNIGEVNSQLADQMEKIISTLANTTMSSAASMNSVLSSLDMALQGSTVYTLGISSSGSVDGQYSVIFGSIKAEDYDVITPRSTLSIYGSTVYVTGDTRGAFTQNVGDTFSTTTYSTLLAIQAYFTQTAASFNADPSSIIDSNDMISGHVLKTLKNSLALSTSENMYTVYPSVWNITYNQYATTSTTQVNASSTFWIPLTSAKLAIVLESGSILKLQATKTMTATSLTVVATYSGVTYTIVAGIGAAKFINVNTTNSMFSYFSSDITATASDGSDTSVLTDNLQQPIVIENIDSFLFNNTAATSPLSFSGYDGNPMRLVFTPQEMSLPQVSSIAQTLLISTLQPSTTYAQSDLQSAINAGTAIGVVGSLIFANQSTIDVTGYQMTKTSNAMYFVSKTTTIVLNSPTYTLVSLSLGGYGIQLTSGTYTSGSQTHITTVMEFSDTQKIRIDGGIIVRNCSNGYVIQNGKVSTEGDVSGTSISVQPQSLLNQAAQAQIGTVLNNTQTYLENNGMTMTDSEINQTATSLLSIAGSLTSALETALNNPLASDLAANLQYAKDNYDSLYNVLPSDPDDIVYVEEMSQSEWASYVTQVLEAQIAKNLANQLQSTLGALENTLAARAIASGNLPYSYYQYVSGTGMAIEINTASSLVGQPFTCNEWTVVLPSPASSLNVDTIQDDTIIQLGLVCYDTNPRLYVSNFVSLITSGAVEAHVNDVNQNLIAINDSINPITITGRGASDAAELTLMMQSEFASYQILDVHAFRTVNWNNSVQFVIYASDDYVPDESGEVYLFSSYQELPGPYVDDFQWMYELSSLTQSTTLFVPASDLVNSTGLFYVGVGKRLSTTNTSSIVAYGEYLGKNWTFAKVVDIDYNFGAISKGCYFYNSDTDLFNSNGMQPNNLEGLEFVNCSSSHLTLFSVGAFNPTTNAQFTYTYSYQNIVKNIRATLSAIFILILYASVMLVDLKAEMRDPSKGRIRFLSDNEPDDGYMYILTVETGYRMFATTDSTICFNLTGTEGDQIFRSLKTIDMEKFDYPFQWGTSSRFLLTTAFPLGALQYLRIWIDEAGLEHRESWYLNRVIVKDLQTQEISYFPFHNWLGTKNGDGETERLARVEPKRRFLDEAMSMQMLSQTISYIAAFTGGGNRERDRTTRYDATTSVALALTLCSIINTFICNWDKSKESTGTFTSFTFGVKDIIIGVVLAILQTLFAMLHILLSYKCRSSREDVLLEAHKKFEKDFKDPSGSWSSNVRFFSRSVCLSIIILGSYVTITIGMQLDEDTVNSFFIRFLIMTILWIVILEPIKGVIWAYIILKKYPSHKISNQLEEEFLHIKPVETFPRNRYGLVEKDLGTQIADITKLRDTEDRKMRDEQLFITVRDMICFFVSLYIMIMLTYYSKDRHGFYYQSQMSTTLNIPMNTYGDSSFMAITTPSNFYTWASDSLANALIATWYDGNPAYDMRAFMNDKVSRSMGIGAIRQVRNKKSANCTIINQWKPYISHCGEDLTEENMETTSKMQVGWEYYDASENMSNVETATGYTYQTADELETRSISGQIGNYPGGGYTVSLSGTASQMAATFSELEANNWIDENTRAIIIEFSQYNAQINYFSVVQLLIEIPRSGVYLPDAWIESVRLIKSGGNGADMVKIYEIAYIVFSILIFIKEIIFYIWGRYQAFKTLPKTRNPIQISVHMILSDFTPWNFMDLIVGCLAIASVITYLLREIHTNAAVDVFNASNGDSYINLSMQRDMDLAFTYCLAGVVFFTSCKMIRILKFNRRIGVLAATLDSALGAIVSFGVALFVFCYAFNSILYVVLGNKLSGYQSMISVFETSLAGLLGKLNVAPVEAISQFAFIVIMIYMQIGSKLLLQLYVTIIMFEFEEVRNDSERQTNDYEILDHIRYKTKRSLGLLQPKDANPVSIPDTQTDFNLFFKAVAKVNLLHHRVHRIIEERTQYKNFDLLKFDVKFDPTEAIEADKRMGIGHKWRSNDLDLK